MALARRFDPLHSTPASDTGPARDADGRPIPFRTINEQDGKGTGYNTGGVGRSFAKSVRTKVGNKGLSTI